MSSSNALRPKMMPASPSVTSVGSTVAARDAATSGGNSAAKAPARWPAGWPQPRRITRSSTRAPRSPRIAEGRRTAHSTGPKTRTMRERTQGKRTGVPEADPSGVAERPRNWSAPPATRFCAPTAPRPSSARNRSGCPRSTSLSRAPTASAAAKRMRPDASGSSEERPDSTAGEYTEASSLRPRVHTSTHDDGPGGAPPQRHAHRPRRRGPPAGRTRFRDLRGRAYRRRGRCDDRPYRGDRAGGGSPCPHASLQRLRPPEERRGGPGDQPLDPVDRRRRNRLAEARPRDPRLPRRGCDRSLASRGLPRSDSPRIPWARAPLRARHRRAARPPVRPDARAVLGRSHPREDSRRGPGRIPRRVGPPPLVSRPRALPREARPLHDARRPSEGGRREGRRRLAARAHPVGVLRPGVPAPWIPRRLGRAHVRGAFVGEHASEIPQAARDGAGDRPRRAHAARGREDRRYRGDTDPRAHAGALTATTA